MSMVGLSVILENNCRDFSEDRRHHHQVIGKGSCMIKSFPSPSSSDPTSPTCVFSRKKTAMMSSTLCGLSSASSSGFLQYCFLCKQKLLTGKDIYMYKGDRAFCSEDCRYRQILMDEEEIQTTAKKGCTREYNCSLSATSSPSSATTTTTNSSRSAKAGTTRSNGAKINAFAY